MSDTMERLSKLAHDQLQAEATVERAELALKAAKDALRILAEETIPGVMEDLDLKEFVTNDGLRIAVPEVVRASITKANEPAAFAWLREHGHGALIKDLFEVLAADEAQARRLKDLFETFDGPLALKEKPSIHNQTLGKFVREAMEAGIILPESISVYRQRVSKVTVS